MRFNQEELYLESSAATKAKTFTHSKNKFIESLSLQTIGKHPQIKNEYSKSYRSFWRI